MTEPAQQPGKLWKGDKAKDWLRKDSNRKPQDWGWQEDPSACPRQSKGKRTIRHRGGQGEV